MIMKTEWNCELCHEAGTVSHEGADAKTGAWEVFQEILHQHHQNNKECGGGRRTIRAKLIRS